MKRPVLVAAVAVFLVAGLPSRLAAQILDLTLRHYNMMLKGAYDLLLAGVDELHKLMVIIHAYSEDQQREAFAHRLCVPGSDATTLAPNGKLAESFFHGAYTWASWFYPST